MPETAIEIPYEALVRLVALGSRVNQLAEEAHAIEEEIGALFEFFAPAHWDADSHAFHTKLSDDAAALRRQLDAGAA